VLRATGATAARFMQLAHTDLGGVTADQHHAQVHNIVGGDHTLAGAQYQIVGATALNALGLLTPSSNPGAASAILRTNAGALTLNTLTVDNDLFVNGTLDFGTDTMYEDASYLYVTGARPVRFAQNIGNANWTVYNAGGADFGGSVNITGNSNLYVSGTVGGAAGVLQTLNDRVGVLCVPDPQFALDVNGPMRAQYFIGPHAIQLKDALLIAHYDGPERGPTGEGNGHMGQPAATTGDVVYRPGKFNKAVEISASYTNLVSNASFESNTTGWSAYSTGTAAGTRTRTQEEAWDGYYSYRMTKTGGANGDRWGVSFGLSVTNGQAYSFSVRVKVVEAVGGTGGIAVLRAEGNVTTATASVATVDNDWIELTLTTTATATATATIYLYLANCTTATAYFDGVQVTATGTQRPFFADGARTAGTLTYSNVAVNWNRCTIMCWFRVADLASLLGRQLRLFELRVDANNTYRLGVGNSNDKLTAYCAGNGVVASPAGAGAVAARTWYHAALVVNGTSVALYLNGVADGTGATLSGSAAGAATAYVGSYFSGEQLNGLIDDFAIINRALTAQEVRAVYESNAPVFAESSTWSWRATPKGLVWADENGLWMRDASGNAVLGVYGGDAGGYSWGGQTLDQGDLLIGRASNYVLWDNSAGTIAFAGNGGGLTSINGANITTGSIAGDRIDLTSYLSIKSNTFGADGIQLQYNGNNPRAYIGDGANQFVKFDGSVLTWKASNTELDASGNLIATSATLSGAITATSGSISGTLTIGASGKITAGSTEISSSGILLPRATITQGDDVFDSPDLTPVNSVTIRYRDTATSWEGADGTYNYAGNTLMRMYSSSAHYVDDGLIGDLWAHALDGVIEAPSPTVPANSGIWMRRLWLIAGTKYLTVGTGGAANGVGINVYNPQKALHVGGTVLIGGDEGGYPSTVGLTNVTDTSVSTGTGTVKMNASTSRNSDAWVKIYIGTTAYWLPAWSNIN
jgi:hypothetical protein